MDQRYDVRRQNIEAKLTATTPVTPTPPPAPQAQPPAPQAQPPAEPIDLLDLAGGGTLKKYGPAVFGAFALAAVVFALGRLRMARNALRRR